ncbi:MAG TPA: amidohydrolase family protein [Polyangiaceae bacterium]|nr:amidohydrolase family protein [Polyangiaceae bacterium]
MRVVVASHLVRGDEPPISDGAVVVADDGSIVEVGPACSVLPSNTGLPIERISGIVMPGLVNAHTHLELSALRGRVPGGGGFLPWVERLIGARVELGPDEESDAVTAAVAELSARGTVAVGEVTNSLAAVHALAGAKIEGCVFHEVFGQDLARLRERVRGLETELHERVGDWPSAGLSYAPAPHTLYTLHLEVVRMILEESRAGGRRTSLHLLEHAAERRALERGEGPVIEWLTARSRVDATSLPWPKEPALDVARDVGALAPDVVLVHLTEARKDELAAVAEAGAPVVVCPRSNLFIEGKLPPLLAMREAGIRPGLGTDSLASNASLDLLAEARALADRFPGVPAWELVRMATDGGARALGLARHGRIQKGARPGLLAIEGEVGGEPCAWLLGHLREPRRLLSEASSS